uniref:Tudor domain-containing protein n=1 Tax=Glossina austeni TaxID=7395 RepID=A0A1A9VLH4_GLOAU
MADWKTSFSPCVGEFLEAMVQFIEKSEGNKYIVWITDIKYDESLRKLMIQIKRNIDANVPCAMNYVRPKALVAVPLNQLYYRGEVLENNAQSQQAIVRLIDYGNVLHLPYKRLYAPLRIMQMVSAYAIWVMLPDYCDSLEIEAVINIRITDQYVPNGIYNAEHKRSPLLLSLEILDKGSYLSLVKCFPDDHNALLRFSSLSNAFDNYVDAILKSSQIMNFPNNIVPGEGSFVAASTLKGWRRARLLGFYKKGNKFLVYALDEGVIM